jgi:hypothetical protein
MNKAWVSDTRQRSVRGDIEPVEMRSRKGTAPMSVRYVRALFDLETAELRSLELVGDRLGKTRYGFRSSNMVRRVDPAHLAEDFVPQQVRDFVEQHRPIVWRQYLVTVKVARNPDHDPTAKRTGECPLSMQCTDVTGQHHTVIVQAVDDDEALRLAQGLGVHITRIERSGVPA